MELNVVKDAIRGNASFLNATEFAAIYYLQNKDITNIANAIKGADIFQETAKIFSDCLTTDGVEVFSKSKSITFIQYLNNLSKVPESSIRSGGRGVGYFLVNQQLDQIQVENISLAENAFKRYKVISSPDPEPSNTDQAQGQLAPSPALKPDKVQREKRLYPHLQSWLTTQEYQAADISQVKSLGPWGNPDVAGINIIETLDRLSIELVTIEAKITSSYWQTYIFEAVSHRRFANRVYFSYAVKESEKEIYDRDIRYYAELYKIGILFVVLSDEDYKTLATGGADAQEFKDEPYVLEIYPAPYSEVNLKHQMKFFEANNIKNKGDAFRWGTNK